MWADDLPVIILGCVIDSPLPPRPQVKAQPSRACRYLSGPQRPRPGKVKSSGSAARIFLARRQAISTRYRGNSAGARKPEIRSDRARRCFRDPPPAASLHLQNCLTSGTRAISAMSQLSSSFLSEIRTIAPSACTASRSRIPSLFASATAIALTSGKPAGRARSRNCPAAHS